MTPGEEQEDLLKRAESSQHELLELLEYVEKSKASLTAAAETVSAATEKLANIGEATEKAAHGLLALVEQAMGLDEAALPKLDALESGVGPELREAVEVLGSAQDERMNILTEIMTAMSFQDLTCQTLAKVSSSLVEVEARLLHVLEPETYPPFDRGQGADAGSMSGLSRLQENQEGASQQDMIDQLLSGR